MVIISLDAVAVIAVVVAAAAAAAVVVGVFAVAIVVSVVVVMPRDGPSMISVLRGVGRETFRPRIGTSRQSISVFPLFFRLFLSRGTRVIISGGAAAPASRGGGGDERTLVGRRVNGR